MKHSIKNILLLTAKPAGGFINIPQSLSLWLGWMLFAVAFVPSAAAQDVIVHLAEYGA